MLKKAVQQGRSDQSRLRSRSRLSEDQTLPLSALTSALTFQKGGGLFQHHARSEFPRQSEADGY